MHFKDLKLMTKLIVAFITVGILPMAVVATILLNKTSDELSQQAFNQLTSIRQIKKNQVERYLNTVQSQIVTFSQDRMVVDAMRGFAEAYDKVLTDNSVDAGQLARFRTGVRDYYDKEFGRVYAEATSVRPDVDGLLNAVGETGIALQHYYISANANPLGSKDKLDRAADRSAYSELHGRVHPVIRSYLKKFGYYDIFLIHPQTGTIVYSVFKELDYATSLLDGPYAGTNFAEAFRQASQATDPDTVIIADFKTYAPSYEAPAGFIASPIFDGGRKIGVAVFQFPIDTLNAIMKERDGMGETGETYLVGADKLMRSDSFLDPEHHSVAASFADPTKGSVDTEAARNALAGKAGTKIIIDYNGNPVLSAYTPVSSGGLKWALLAEIDEAEAFAAVRAMRWITLLVAGVGFAAVLAVAWLIGRSIAGPIKRITEKMDAGADQVASASGEIATTSHSLAEGASEQAASIEETGASLEEMASVTRQNAEHGEQADRLMKEANTVVTKANSAMEGLKSSMAEISAASEETSKIIKTIDEIAFQTNLLALNAAVEAARAGAAGAGFAVVADEVRNLAIRAADAARNTSELIEGNVAKIASGSKLVQSTDEAFTEVAEKASKVGALVGEIATASKEQAQGIDQVNQAVNEMDRVTQQNAASAEESASAAEEMSGQAIQMKAMVDQLNTLVQGAKGRRIDTPEETVFAPKRKAGRNIKAGAKTIAGRTSASGTGNTTDRPDQVIPFGEDFEDF